VKFNASFPGYSVTAFDDSAQPAEGLNSIRCLFFSLFCLIAMVKTSSIILNKSSESRYSCLVFELRRISDVHC
jgi:hypothetical protein